MKYEDLLPGDSIVTPSNGEVWTLLTPLDELGYATWMCMTDGDKMELAMSGTIPDVYQVCLIPREGT